MGQRCELLRDMGQLGNPEGTVDHIKEGFKDPKKIFDPLGPLFVRINIQMAGLNETAIALRAQAQDEGALAGPRRAV